MENAITEVLKILNAYIQSDKYVIKENVDISQLMRLAKEQEIVGIIAHMLIDCVEEPLKNEFKQIIFYEFSQCVIKEEVKINLEKLFNENKIKYSFFKGMYINQFYPIPELRTMSDIDVIVEKSKFELTTKLMENMGYKKTDGIFNVHCMEKDGIAVEIHSAFVSNDFVIADSTDIVDNKLSNDKHFEILLTHCARHLLSCGCGIRMFLDIIFFAQYNEINYVNVAEKMKEYKLDKFYYTVLAFIEKEFSICINGIDNEIITEQFTKELEKYIFSGGIFGKEDKTLGEVKRANSKSLFGVFFSIAFPKARAMKIYYPVLEKKPYLLWHYYAKRIFSILKEGGNKKKLKGVLKNKDKAEYQRYIKEKLGLL